MCGFAVPQELRNTNTVLQIPESLLLIPEVVEINALLTKGLGYSDIIEATLPPLSFETRVLLQEYLKQIEQDSRYITELMVFDDVEVIYITEMPVELMTFVSANA